MKPSTDPAKNALGEYRQWLHVFQFIEQARLDNHGVSISEHYCYPWPVSCQPDFEYITAVHSMTKFNYWPPAWKSFFAEFSLCGPDIVVTQANVERVSKLLPNSAKAYGPYMLLLPSQSIALVASRLVVIKREARREMEVKFAYRLRSKNLVEANATYTEFLSALHETIVRRVLKHYEPYRVHTWKEMQCA